MQTDADLKPNSAKASR